MMILSFLNDWLKEILVGGIMSNFTGIFDEINTKVGEIAGQVGQTPQGWNAEIFGMVRTLSETVILPVAGIILTFVAGYELIQMITERNNMADTDTFMFFKWIFKTFCAVLLLTNTFDIVMGIFELAQDVVNSSSGIITGSIEADVSLATLRTSLEAMEVADLIGLWLQSFIMRFAMLVMSMVIFVVIYGRMIQIYLTISIAPIPLSTMANRELGSMGTNYLKSLIALGFQGFLIMVCIAIYSVLINSAVVSPDVNEAMMSSIIYTILLCITLFQTHNISNRVFGAH